MANTDFNNIYVAQMCVFDNGCVNHSIALGSNPRAAKRLIPTTFEHGNVSIVSSVKNLSVFTEQDREAIYRLYDESAESYDDSTAWCDFSKTGFSRKRIDTQLYANDKSATESVRAMFFSTDGAILIQNEADMKNSFDTIMASREKKPRSVVKKSDAYAFERAQREFERESMASYTDGGESLDSSCDSFEAIGFDPSHGI